MGKKYEKYDETMNYNTVVVKGSNLSALCIEYFQYIGR